MALQCRLLPQSVGHAQVVRQPLMAGADVNVLIGFFGTALVAASFGGNDQIIQQLLELATQSQ